MARIAPQSSIYCFRSLSRYSNTRVSDLSVWTMSWRVTRNKRMMVNIVTTCGRDREGQNRRSRHPIGNMVKILFMATQKKIYQRICANLSILLNIRIQARDFNGRHIWLVNAEGKIYCNGRWARIQCSRNDLQFQHPSVPRSLVWTPCTWGELLNTCTI